MLTVLLVGTAIVAGIGAFGIIFSLFIGAMMLGDGMSRKDRRDIQNMIKASGAILLGSVLWPLVIPYLLFTLVWHIFSESGRDHTWPHPWARA